MNTKNSKKNFKIGDLVYNVASKSFYIVVAIKKPALNPRHGPNQQHYEFRNLNRITDNYVYDSNGSYNGVNSMIGTLWFHASDVLNSMENPTSIITHRL